MRHLKQTEEALRPGDTSCGTSFISGVVKTDKSLLLWQLHHQAQEIKSPLPWGHPAVPSPSSLHLTPPPPTLPLTLQMWSDHHGEGLTTSGSDYGQTIQLYQLHPLY
ncbi:unnamed protein product [Pleuronectes platessa]|uniref:Uncharacterized protein n=1 Tax=Pleuronectes platessa TaxID=8262 RepID=A0A9N7YER5_PLEPL|nr:unnamed protein product [Pleuronectes platessa]